MRGVEQLTELAETRVAQRSGGGEHALVLGHDVPRASEQRAREAVEVGRVAQGRDAELLGGLAALRYPIVVGALGQAAANARVHDEEGQLGRHGDRLDRDRTAVDQERVAGLAGCAR